MAKNELWLRMGKTAEKAKKKEKDKKETAMLHRAKTIGAKVDAPLAHLAEVVGMPKFADLPSILKQSTLEVLEELQTIANYVDRVTGGDFSAPRGEFEDMNKIKTLVAGAKKKEDVVRLMLRQLSSL